MRTTLLAALTLLSIGAAARWAGAADEWVGAAAAERTLAPVAVRPPARDAVVELRLFRFQPDSVRIPAGTRVVWANADDIAHGVVSGAPERPDGRIAVQLPRLGDRADTRFDEPGRYLVHCDRHPFMQAIVHVVTRGDHP